MSLNHLQSAIGPRIVYNDQTYLYFGGTAYLGIPQSDDFLKIYLEGLKKYGINNGTSRSNNVQLGIYNDAEVCSAERFGSEGALITSSGYLAAQLAVKHALGFGELRYAPDTHPALWHERNPKVNKSFSNWALGIVKEINESQQQNWVLITNSMNNLHPERYDFSFIEKLNKQVLLVIDDSHGIGVNSNGLGAFPNLPKCGNIEVVLLASMAKALGVDAGLILGSTKTIASMKQTNEFLGASPPSAAGLYAFMKGEEIYAANLAKLKNNMNLLANELSGSENWNFMTDFPVYLAKNTDLSRILKQKGVLISSFPYPDKDGPIINRVVLGSWHNTSDIEKLIKALKNR